MITALRIIQDKKRDEVLSGCIDQYIPTSKSSCFLATGRSAINHLISKIGFTKNTSVLLPVYVAEGIIQPFIKSKIPIKFYKLDHNLFPDTVDISEILEKDHSIKLCVVVHPFGFEAPIKPLIELLIQKNVFLLEDCAQGIFSRYKDDNLPFGGKGDFALYSLNKFLPVLDGAILLSQVEKINISLDCVELTPLNKKALGAYKLHLERNRDIFLNSHQYEIRKLLNESSKQYEKYYELISDDLGIHKLCRYSDRIIKSFDYERFLLTRKKNVSILYKNISNNKFQLLYQESNNIIPMAVPVIFRKSRTKYIEKLFKHGIILALQVDRWNFLPMTNDEKRFTNEKNFINKHALIPINEFINEESMNYMIEELNNL